MSTTTKQNVYLQKYLGGSSGDKKKKKKKVVKGKGFKIIDDDIDLSKLRPLDGDELDILDQGEDAPQIAGIIDERPEELKKLEQFKTSSKWRVVNQDDGFNSKLQIEEIKSNIKNTEKNNEIIFGKMYSDSEDEKKNDSDLSPPRKSNVNENSLKKHDNDSDASPPRKDHSISPKRQSSKTTDDQKSHRNKNKSKYKVRKSRWSDKSPEQGSPRQQSRSPTRQSKKDVRCRSKSSDQSPPRYKKNYDSDASPPRKPRKHYNSEVSPVRKSKNQSPSRQSKNSNVISPKKHKRAYNSDISPPRKHKKNHDSEESPMKSNKRHISPESSSTSKRWKSPQTGRRDSQYDYKRYSSYKSDGPRERRHSPDFHKRKTSISPPRKFKKHTPENNKRKYNSDSDQSPPRRNRDRSISEKEKNKRDKDSPPPSDKKMARTLEGKKAGLQDARQLREENAEFRKKEDDVFNKMTDEVSGRNAQIVSRKSKRDTSEDRQKQREKAERQKELDEKYKKWSTGLKQVEDQETRVQEFLHEAAKPLARHRDDKDLDRNLRRTERAGDPMLQYIRQKKRERGELAPEKPTYKGSFPPNRFNIRPGHRWDGVDRSNGYEKKYFEQQSKRKAQEEEAYKWSTEDL